MDSCNDFDPTSATVRSTIRLVQKIIREMLFIKQKKQKAWLMLIVSRIYFNFNTPW